MEAKLSALNRDCVTVAVQRPLWPQVVITGYLAHYKTVERFICDMVKHSSIISKQ